AVHAAPPAAIYARSLHDALPIFAEGQHAVALGSVSHFAPMRMVAVLLASPGIASGRLQMAPGIGADPDVTISRGNGQGIDAPDGFRRSEEHTSELQSRENLVCRLLLEKLRLPP